MGAASEAMDQIERAIGDLEMSQQLLSFLSEWALDEGELTTDLAKQARQSLEFAIRQHCRFLETLSAAYQHAHPIIVRGEHRRAEAANA